MKLSTLVKADLSRSKRRLAVVAVAVAASVAVVVLLGSLVLGVQRHVVEPLLPKLPLDLIKVEAKTLSVGLLAFEGKGFDDATVARLAKLAGVQKVYPIVGAAFPMRAEGGEGFIGRRMRTDVFATGVETSLVAADVAKGYSFEEEKDGRVPVIVSRRLLDLYNSTVASAIEKPKLSEDMVIGFEFDLVLGSSYARGTPDPSKVRRLTAQIVGLSDHATLVGVTVPEKTVRRWNKTLSGKKSPVAGAYVKTRDPSQVGEVTRAIERLGMRVDDTAKIAGAAIAIASVLIALFGGTLLALSAFAIAQTFFLLVGERRMELAILRALGAKKGDLFRMVLLEALFVGLVGGAIGVLLGGGAGALLDWLIIEQIPDIPFKPTRVVSLEPLLLVGAFGLGVVAALVGAALPASKAASASPATALRS